MIFNEKSIFKKIIVKIFERTGLIVKRLKMDEFVNICDFIFVFCDLVQVIMSSICLRSNSTGPVATTLPLNLNMYKYSYKGTSQLSVYAEGEISKIKPSELLQQTAI